MKPLHYAMQIAYSSKDVLMHTYEMAVKFKDTPGCYVECGVAAGAQVIAMAYGAPSKTIYAFDSFEGIPLPSNRDDQMPGIMKLTPTEQKMLPDAGKQVLETSGATAVSEDTFWEHIDNALGSHGPTYSIPTMLKYPKIRTIVGWFEQTIPKVSDIIYPITTLRLDGDLYNSTWVCLLYLFGNVVPGGCVIIDDWTLKGCQDACKEYFELIGYTPNYQYLDGTAWFYK